MLSSIAANGNDTKFNLVAENYYIYLFSQSFKWNLFLDLLLLFPLFHFVPANIHSVHGEPKSLSFNIKILNIESLKLTITINEFKCLKNKLLCS